MIPNSSRLPLVWYKNAKTDEEKEKVTQLILNSQQFSQLLLSVLRDYYENIERKGKKEDDYKEAGILALMAFRNGELAMLEKIAELFNFMTKKDVN